MFVYQCQLAWRSICKTPVLCGLMVLVIGLGVAATMITFTTKYTLDKNHLAHKDDVLFLVKTDSWSEMVPYRVVGKRDIPSAMSYRDVVALLKSDIPFRKLAMTVTGGTFSVPEVGIKPLLMRGRIATRDFFTMFERKFIYGSTWDSSADTNPKDLIVLSEDTNQKLFSGKNSVGKSILFEGAVYQIIGVVENEQGSNLQDVDFRTDSPSDQFYLPFGVLTVRSFQQWRPTFCGPDDRNYGDGWEGLLAGSCLWLTHWVEFSNEQQKQDYESFIKHYIAEQKTLGFYPRPLRFSLDNISENIKLIGYDLPFLVIIFYFGCGFFMVCVVNAIAMLTAKFMKSMAELGVRRALGANRSNIFLQHLLECSFIGFLGGILGVVITYLGLAVLRRTFAVTPSINGVSEVNMERLFVPDTTILLLTIFVGISASLCAGLYPFWRVCRAPVAQYLKLQ